MKSFYEYYMNIGLFGTYFNLILDKIGFSVNQFWKYYATIGRYKVFEQMSLILMSLFR